MGELKKMYINLTKIIQIGGLVVSLVAIGFGLYKFIVAANINQQIASTLVATFGLQLMWFVLWITAGRKR